MFHLAANVHDLYKQATLETHGSFLFLLGIAIVVVVGAITKVYFEGPSCPSSAKLTGKIQVIPVEKGLKKLMLLSCRVAN